MVDSTTERNERVPDKSPKKPDSKKVAAKSLKEKRQDKKSKGGKGFMEMRTGLAAGSG